MRPVEQRHGGDQHESGAGGPHATPGLAPRPELVLISPAAPALAAVSSTPAGPARGRRILSIRWIVCAAVAALITLIMFVAGSLSERTTRATLTAQIESRLRLQSQNLALASARVLLGEFPELTIQPLVNDVLARQPDLAIAAVVDRAGRVQGHLDARALGAPLELPPGLAPVVGSRDAGGSELHASAEMLVAETPV